MKIAMYQMKMEHTQEANLRKCLAAIETAAENGADMIVFPELTLMPFFPQYEKLDVEDRVLTTDSQTVGAFKDSCRKNRIYAVPNFYLSDGGKRYDASCLITPEGELQGIQKMVHIAQAEQFYEQDYYTPSDDGFLVFPTPHGNIGIVVCFDRHYPESIRTESLRGADLILVPTANTKAEPMEMFEWEIRVQAFQNCVPIVMCNRTGLEDEMDFAGESIAVDENGALLAKADDKEQLLYADIDLAQTSKTKAKRPYLSLRRLKTYE